MLGILNFMTELSPRQREVLAFLILFLKENGYPPTLREIGLHFRIAASSVFGHLTCLEKKGHIKRSKAKSRCIEILRGSGHEHDHAS